MYNITDADYTGEVKSVSTSLTAKPKTAIAGAGSEAMAQLEITFNLFFLTKAGINLRVI